MTEPRKPIGFAEALKVHDIRLYLGTVGFATLASRALAVVIGFQIYQITRTPLALGLLGLIEAIPAISLVLFGGYVADHFNRHKILLATSASSFLCAVALALLSWKANGASMLFGLYGVTFLAGVSRGFADPASTAFEAQIVPKPLAVNAGSWLSSAWISCSVLGPAAIGFIFEAGGARTSYLLIAACYALCWLCTVAIPAKTQILPKDKEPLFKSMGIGWKFVFKNQPLLGALALDLFAVLFGGAMALLPVFAETILHTGAKGLGLLNAAPSLGALLASLVATRHPPVGKAGRNLLLTVTGFGVSMIVFAFSKNFALSMAALFFSGVFDGVSISIRRAMIRLLSPDEMRGRIAAANSIFITASNELGAFESGMVAAWLGTIPCVALGGVVTLGVVALTAALAPELRALRFDLRTFERQS